MKVLKIRYGDIKENWNSELDEIENTYSSLASVFPSALPHSKHHMHLHSLSSHLSLSTWQTLYMGPAGAAFADRKSDVLLLTLH